MTSNRHQLTINRQELVFGSYFRGPDPLSMN
jgi:hypothetical protein